MHQSHTFANRYKPSHRPKFAKECACPTQEEIHFFLPSLRCFNFFTNVQPMTDKHFDSSKCKQKVVQLDTDDRTPSANSGFAKKRVQWLKEHSTSHQLLCYVDSFELRNPLLRKAANR